MALRQRRNWFLAAIFALIGARGGAASAQGAFDSFDPPADSASGQLAGRFGRLAPGLP